MHEYFAARWRTLDLSDVASGKWLVYLHSGNEMSELQLLSWPEARPKVAIVMGAVLFDGPPDITQVFAAMLTGAEWVPCGFKRVELMPGESFSEVVRLDVPAEVTS